MFKMVDIVRLFLNASQIALNSLAEPDVIVLIKTRTLNIST